MTTRRYRRTRRARGIKLALFDRLLLCGCIAGAVYLLLLHVLHTPSTLAKIAGLVTLGFAVAITTVTSTTLRLRSPIVWRKR